MNVACHLLLDADIVVLDRPTRGMDIFDTFFLVEYLRQWAARGRIVILTLQVKNTNARLCKIIPSFRISNSSFNLCLFSKTSLTSENIATNIRNTNDDLEGSFNIYWSHDVLRKAKRNVALFCIHRLSLPCI